MALRFFLRFPAFSKVFNSTLAQAKPPLDSAGVRCAEFAHGKKKRGRWGGCGETTGKRGGRWADELRRRRQEECAFVP